MSLGEDRVRQRPACPKNGRYFFFLGFQVRAIQALLPPVMRGWARLTFRLALLPNVTPLLVVLTTLPQLPISASNDRCLRTVHPLWGGALVAGDRGDQLPGVAESTPA
jgi:hypothetical protein